MPTSALAVSLPCSNGVSVTVSNRRVRTRTHGGVAGSAGDRRPYADQWVLRRVAPGCFLKRIDQGTVIVTVTFAVPMSTRHLGPTVPEHVPGPKVTSPKGLDGNPLIATLSVLLKVALWVLHPGPQSMGELMNSPAESATPARTPPPPVLLTVSVKSSVKNARTVRGMAIVSVHSRFEPVQSPSHRDSAKPDFPSLCRGRRVCNAIHSVQRFGRAVLVRRPAPPVAIRPGPDPDAAVSSGRSDDYQRL